MLKHGKTQTSRSSRQRQMPVNVQGYLFWWVGQKRSSWRNLERYIRDILYVILNSRLRCFHLIQNVGIRSVAWSKQCLEQLICLQDRFIGGETWVREDLWGICFIEQTWDAMSLNRISGYGYKKEKTKREVRVGP